MESIAVNGGVPVDRTFTYNAANQVSSNGFTYDDNGNLSWDGSNSYVWDRANRLLSMGDSAYQYDGTGNRIRQTVNSIVTQYLLDVQPGLVKVLTRDTGGSVQRYNFGPHGILTQWDAAGNPEWLFQDGLGSVRVIADAAGSVASFEHYASYGDPLEPGTFGTPFTFKPSCAIIRLEARTPRFLNRS